jgi:hypothetical protein
MELYAVPLVREHAVQHQHVQVDVEIERAAEALHDRNCAAAGVGDVVTACPPPEESEHLPHGHAANGPTQVVIPREDVPQPIRQTGDPLADRHVGKNMIDEMCGALRHAGAAAAWTESAPLA